MDDLKLYMLLLGCTPKGRNTEQHDIFFGIGTSLKELVPEIKKFWTEPKDLHIDAWREVTFVDGYTIKPHLRDAIADPDGLKLFFINLGGYRKNDFDEYHHKMLIVAKDMATAVARSKQHLFYKQTGFKTAPSHIDEKYGFDVDEVYKVEEILPEVFAANYSLAISKSEAAEDTFHLGYLTLSKLATSI